MSSVRMLKKEIDNQIFEIISDCFVYQGLHPETKSREAAKIIEDAVTLRNDLISRTNNPENKNDTRLVRKHYRAIKSDLTKGMDKFCKRLSSLSEKKK